jgi:hypothetical protein
MKRPCFPSVLLFALLVTSSVCSLPAAEPDSPDTPPVAEKVRQSMQDRNYAEAVKAIDEALGAKDAPKDYLTYLKGRALYLQQQYDQSVAVFERFEKDFPKSDWARHARFGKALALAHKGDFRAAELICRAEAEYLLSADRKQQIADIYLEFADNYFQPPKEEQKPDYQKALDYYQQALEVGPKPQKKAEVELLVAQCLQRLGKLSEAAGRYEQFIKEHADSPLDVEARYRLGECRLAEGDLKSARRCWQDLLAKDLESRSERVAEAAFHLAKTWRIPQPGSEEELSLGTAALEAFIERFPSHKLASQAHLEIAKSYLHRRRLEDAVTSLKRFLADPRYQDRDEIPDARNLLGLSYQLQKKFPEALATWQQYLVKHPAHQAWSAVQRQIVSTEFLMAAEQLQAKQYDSARKLFAEFLAKYPLDSRNPQILLLVARSYYDEEKWDAALAQWRRLVSKYPGTSEASQAQYLIGSTLEEKLGKLEEALEEYRKVTWGAALGQAQQAIARLTAKTMAVATERTFRSDETPVLKLITRNIESVTVRAYKVDLETYFRKMHLARGVEGLDIALIDPDKTFEFPVPHYAKYQQLESAVEVPLPGESRAGVMAVTLSSKTLEATTLVIQSDLDVIVKSSRDEVFVFAENMRTGRPWADAKLLLSNGQQVFAEGSTGRDGVFQKSYQQLKDAGDVRVFAIAGGHVASNVVGLQGVGLSRGLADKGYIYTDRPAYRAGQLVHLRGCLRRASDDAYTIEKGKKYTLEVFDSRNRPLRQDAVRLNEFGTFCAHFILPPDSPQGEFRVLVRDESGKQNYQGTFLVHEYQLEPVQLLVDKPRTVYYRGEEIEGTIRAAFYYGAPLSGREIRYQLADQRQYIATTDEKGEVHFKLPTREFSETQVLPLVVTLPERNLQTAVNIVLAARGFSIGLSTVRPVYVAGETFELKLSTTDAEGKPTAQKLTLKVLEQTTVEGKVGERLVEEHPLQTAADGAARQTLKLSKGSSYVLRAEGIDRFHNVVSGQCAVQISDDEDRVRLRILADAHTYKVGDTAAVTLHWREEPALALVAFQGARVLDYKLVELKKGPNELKIPITARLAPNFELAVAAMTDPREGRKAEEPSSLSLRERAGVRADVSGAEQGDQTGKNPHPNPLPKGEGTKQPKGEGTNKPIVRFHEATSPFTVERDLRVTIATKRKDGAQGPVRPGEELEVVLTTTDPQGKPVAAEVSLAMVEQSLLDRFGWQVAPIQDFFRGEPRQAAVRTTSSSTFAYRPATQPINPRLLAEQDRLEVAREEEESIKSAVAARSRREAASGPTAAPEAADQPTASPPAGTSELIGAAQIEMLDGLDVLALRGNRRDAAVVDELVRKQEKLGALTERFNSVGDEAVLGYATDKEARERSAAPAGGLALSRSAGRANEAAVLFSRKGDKYGWKYDADDLMQLGDFGYQRTAGGFLMGNDRVSREISNGAFFARATADDLSRLVAQQRNQVVILDGSGRMSNLGLLASAGGKWNEKKAEALAADLAKSGAVLLAAAFAQETGYWNPAVTTGPDGKAAVTITVPERSTAWKLLAKGITTETLAGEAADALVVKKDLFGQLKLPLSFTDGDQAEVLASVHNDVVEKGQIAVTLKTTIAGRSVEEKKTIDVKAKGIHELAFKTVLNRPEAQDQAAVEAAPETNVVFELTVSASEKKDVVRRTVPLKPYGSPVFATASGAATSDTTAWVEAPQKMPLARPGMQILVGPTVEQSLLDIVLGPAPWCQIETSRFTAGLETAASDLMAALALQKLLGAARNAGGPQAQSLDGRIRSSLSLLISAQNDDGGWSWTGRAGNSQRYGSARVVWALSLAKKAGYPVPDNSYNKALGYLQNQVAATSDSDYESKAILLHALSTAGQGDFALANRLYRNRPALSAGALVHLALAFAEMDRKPTAGEILDLLGQRNLDDPASRRKAAQGSLPWSQSPVELRALWALALQEVTPKAPKAKELIDWLLANRTGHRFSPDKATGPAALALCRWFAESRFAGERYQLSVFVNDVQAKVLQIDPAAGTQVIDVPAALLKKEGKQRINFQIAGRGRYTYQCILGGFVPAEKLSSTTPEWRVHRTYQPAPLEVDGREIPRGFGVLQGSYNTFENPLGQLPVGRRGVVELNLWRANVPPNTPDEQLEYLVVTEPIPSGTTVIEKSLSGGFERFEVTPGAITFYVGSRQHVGTIRYELYGYLPGQYRAAPTVVRNAHRPEQLVVSGPKSLAVLPPGAKSSDEYRLTPQELYELGKHYFDKGDMPTAGRHLGELLSNSKWNLKAEVYKHTVQMLLDVHLQTGPPAQVVRYFEIIKEKWPAEEIPFAKIVQVGAAYHEMGEYERSYLVFRATVESSFMRESRVAGFLEAQGEFARSVAVMGRLLHEYPPEGYAAAAAYALAQRVYAKAPEAANDPGLRKLKINRVDLVRRAWSMLEGFLTAYPDDPAADQAAFAAANALLELKDYQEASAACDRYAERYPKSDLLDSFWYMIGYCHFATGRHQAALEMCRKVAEAMRTDEKSGRQVESRNKWRAIYILGQVYHSLGEAVDAIREYRRVEDRFADAKQSIEYFLRKSIELPEVTTIPPGGPAEVELKFRNIAACDAKVYRIDLMKFSLLKRNLGGITHINLAGIRPYHEATVTLGDGKDYRDRTHKLPLPLKEEGAYLLVCRGEDLHASGLVLLTPLGVEVQEDTTAGRVRTTLKDRTADRYLNNVHVKVIGSRNEDFISGSTDLRGVFVADGIKGTSTVIAQAEPSRYAFFRGQTELAVDEAGKKLPAPPAEGKPPAKPAPTRGAKASASLDSDLLEDLQGTNRAFQGKQVEQLKQMYDNKQTGVEAQKAF